MHLLILMSGMAFQLTTDNGKEMGFCTSGLVDSAGSSREGAQEAYVRVRVCVYRHALGWAGE